MAPLGVSGLRAAVESGDCSRIHEQLTPDAVLHTSNEASRRQVSGADTIVEHLSRPGPGHRRDRHARSDRRHLSFERDGDSGTDRRRWYLRANADAAIDELSSTAARPTSGDGGPQIAPPSGLLGRLGAVDVIALSHGGSSRPREFSCSGASPPARPSAPG